MQNKSGFTLIEELFVISIIVLLSVFTLSYTFNFKPKISLKQQCNQIVSLLEEGKSKSIINHEKIDIEIASNKITYKGIDKERTINLNDNYYIDDSYEFHFNDKGNISSGGHLNICDKSVCKSIVLNVGSGAIYVK